MKRFFLGICIVGFIVACSSSSTDDVPQNVDDFDRGAMLTNLADNIIIPAFQDLSNKLGVLKSDKDAFIATSNQSNLDALRNSWLEAYKVWQYVEMLNIGKAEEILYAFQMNVYPVAVKDIEDNITTGVYDLTHPNNNDAVGFPAIDYLLYGLADDDTTILSKYEDDNYTKYLSDIIDQMDALTIDVLNDWTTSYRSTFITSTTNTATSAVNKLVNDFIFYYEKNLRANKIGIPVGNFSTDPLPEKVEAFYNQEVSKVLAKEGLTAVQDFFNGSSYTTSTTGQSFKTYLDHLGETELSALIISRLSDAEGKIELLDNNFYNQIKTDETKMTQAYDALQLVVVALKVDMLQAFNISVDFVDADGD